MPERFAIYFAPPADGLLWTRAVQWLGRDPAGQAVEPPDIFGIGTERRLAISTSARRYGFHATIKAPFALAAGKGRDELEAALAAFAEATCGAAIGRLKLAFIEGFLALIPETQTAELTAFAAAVVSHFEPFRAAIAPGSRQKRIETGQLSPHQVALLDLYGYPYVMDEFRFHMTLTDRLPDEVRAPVMAAAQSWFADAITVPYELDRLALFHEPGAGEPFARRADFALKSLETAHA